jgi:hypothetical protein
MDLICGVWKRGHGTEVEGIFSVGNCFLLHMAKVFALEAVRLEVCVYDGG